ncbi:hypothetical protein [Dongia sp.]|jgi:hypothetical protein|uniref:hypothetical protein n=1 Tax=Dongia sp. TaxID=1977262 RepID=UPI0035ADB421
MLCTAVLLAACTPGRIDYVHVNSTYTPRQYATIPYTKAMRADVSGNPFDMPQKDFNRLVNAAIQPPGVQQSDASPYVIHFAFGLSAMSVDYACRASGRTGKGGGSVAVTAAFCRGTGAALTYLVASVDGITGPEDPRFRQFLRSIVFRLFPRQTEDSRENDRPCFMPGC